MADLDLRTQLTATPLIRQAQTLALSMLRLTQLRQSLLMRRP
jgi:hypothetical protein